MSCSVNRKIVPSYEIYIALYQAITGPDESNKIFRQVSPDFFGLVVIDECHRVNAADDDAWREILDYFSNATEQRRIVAKVDELFALCNTLKQRLSEVLTIQNQLAGMVAEGANN